MGRTFDTPLIRPPPDPIFLHLAVVGNPAMQRSAKA